jgi:hypothetical protein
MSRYVPTDAQFIEAFSTARVSRARLARYYLRALEKQRKGDSQPEYVANEEVSEIDLEHVLPLTPSDQWNVEADVARTAQRLLGNMALIRRNQNRDVANKPFSEKKEIFRSSGYFTTRDIAKFETWDLDTIRQRQTDLAAIAAKTWSLTFPDGI